MTDSIRTYIVTGAAGGIGGATAERLLKTGANVVGTDISQRRLDALAERSSHLPGKLATIRADITGEAAAKGVVEMALDTYGDLHGVANVCGGMVNIHGASMDIPLSVCDLDYFHQTFALNVDTALLMSKHAEPHFEKKGYGKIVNTASMAAFANHHELGDLAYNPAKAAVVALTQTLSLLLGPKGIRVNCIAPGLVKSDKVKQTFGKDFEDRHIAITALGHLATPADLAEGFAFFLEPQSDAISGEVLRVSAGFR
tara:strand:+ start:7316 stop:8083 length:768 start_codon:yes stop_codon:yes gene_type:complete